MSWFKKRLSEPTTYIGIGLLTNGAMILTKADPQHTQIVTDTITQAAQPLASADWTTAATFILSGLMAVFMGEQGKN